MMVYVFSSIAEVAELVDAQDSGSCEEIPRAGSIPVFGTISSRNMLKYHMFF